MKPSFNQTLTRPDSSVSLGFFMALMLTFLQEGFTYYLSTQMLALGLVLTLIYLCRASLVNFTHLFLMFGLLFFSLALTAVISPMVITRNSSNILATIISLMGYACLIAMFASLLPRRVSLILHSFRFASAAAVFTLAGLIGLTELNFIPFLSRDTLFMQNRRLVTNFADEGQLEKTLALSRMQEDMAPRMDLFYGEPSYLAIVLFTCVVCFILTSRVIAEFRDGSLFVSSKWAENGKYGRNVLVVGVLSLLSLQSLSSIMYALILLFLKFAGKLRRHLSFSKLMVFTVFTIIAVFAYRDSFQYLLFRLTMEESVSLMQRFSSLQDFGVSDYLFGLKDEAKIPEEGFHNGLLYIIAISGLAGIWYIFFIVGAVRQLAKQIEMSLLLTLLVLALFMQNGAVFSPNKVVLFALILLPLSCVRTLHRRRKVNFSKEMIQ